MKVIVIGKKYYYEDRTYKQGAVFDWDTNKYKLSSQVKAVKNDVVVGDPEPKKVSSPTTLHEMAESKKPNVSSPSKKK